MRVKQLIGKAAGEIQDLPFQVAQTLLAMGQVEKVEEDASEVETATVEAPEHAVSRGGKRAK